MDERYFERIEAQLDEAIDRARRARERGGDPSTDVEIPVAKDMADRVENILGINGVADRVRALERDPDVSREEAALELAADFAAGRVGTDESRAGRIEGAVRTAVALLTEGVVAAPIEGIDRVEIVTDDDGSEFVRVFYAGPIRSAGGTAQALSVLVADYTRTLIGLDAYRPREAEVERYVEELELYDDETGLQYAPSATETRYIARHCPVMLDGEATGDAEVSGYRDVERVGTNNPRGGMCLVLGEGIAQKAPKIQRYTTRLAEVDWPWLADLIDGSVGPGTEAAEAAETPENSVVDAAAAPVTEDGPPRADASKKYLRDLIAGRPVFGHPSEPGGFRLRYGRARNHGFATAGVHPATMHLVDDFLATGTQLKTELPGKAAGVVPVDSIEGPTVRLANGDVRRIDDPAEARELRNGVEAIIDLGEYLVNYGEFVENNQPLAPAAYVREWWIQDMAAAGADVQAMRDDPQVDLVSPAATTALEWAREYDAPLHPRHTYLWHDLSVDAFEALVAAVADGEFVATDGATATDAGVPPDAGPTLSIAATPETCAALEALLVEHRQGERITIPQWRPLVACLGLSADLEREWTDLSTAAREWPNAMRAVREVAPVRVRERAPTRVGCRMGRPEKSEQRELNPAVHTLFPIGDAGGDQRDVGAAATAGDDISDDRGQVTVQVGRRRCGDCATMSYWARCPECNATTEAVHQCPDCDREVTPDATGRAECPRCETRARQVERRPVDVGSALASALAAVGERESGYEMLKGVKGMSSAAKVPEPLEKGILRATNGVSAFKDGTVRYDMTDLPVTAVRPAELDVSAARLRELGYRADVHGEPLEHDDQLVELKVQDVVLSDGAGAHMQRTADFVDDLLTRYYGLEPFYEVSERADLVGELVFGLAPHTSAAVVGRVVGFTSAAVGYAHPYFHAAKRRNCDGDEDSVMLLMDGLLNFSTAYLPDRRGGRMDAPLVMSSRIDPAEIDDEAHNVDIVDRYPRSFYEATRRLADPDDVDVRLAAATLGTESAYDGFRHTHDTSDIAAGPALSAYKTLGSMMDKMDAQLALARKLRAVAESDVAERVIEYHFLPDLIGNLRAFSRQETRCLDCGTKYRRMPLSSTCRACGGTVNLTVHEGSVDKYLDPAVRVAEEFGCREYTKQRLEILRRSIESIFEDDTNKQSGIADFM